METQTNTHALMLCSCGEQWPCTVRQNASAYRPEIVATHVCVVTPPPSFVPWTGPGWHRCRTCGCAWDTHRAADGACSPGGSFGSWERFPQAGRAINHPATEARATLAWDRRIVSHWKRSRGRWAP
jgi:hypothetical protein